MTVPVPRTRNRIRIAVIHAGRVGLVLALLSLVPSPPTDGTEGAERAAPPSAERVQALLRRSRETGDGGAIAEFDTLDTEQDARGLWPLRDASGNAIGYAARTLPAAADIVGYRGPTDALLLLDPERQIVAVALHSSRDTEEHVAALEQEPAFYEQFVGWPWGGPPPGTQVDAVSGATLTSLALAEGVLKRIGVDQPPQSLVFSDPIGHEEVLASIPDADHFEGDPIAEVFDTDGERLGWVIRSGPLSDDRLGYQGPTELLITFSADRRVESARIRSSLDNEPYVDYVREEDSFWQRYVGLAPEDLTELDPEAAGIEGVSGATMTSLAVAETVAAAAGEIDLSPDETVSWRAWMAAGWAELRWTRPEVVTLAMVLLVAVASRGGWFRNRRFRRVWLVTVIALIGLWTGNLVSMALVAGWSAEGIAWRLAPGLAAITLVAVVAPPLSGGNPYCNHLCPHGAAQQLIRPRSGARRLRRLPAPIAHRLAKLPGLTLTLAYLALILVPRVDLSSWEPFHAYLFRLAGWSSIGLALATLLFAAVIPMGYCRFGCPTGRLLGYLRRSAQSDRLLPADGVALVLLLVALAVRGAGSI